MMTQQIDPARRKTIARQVTGVLVAATLVVLQSSTALAQASQSNGNGSGHGMGLKLGQVQLLLGKFGDAGQNRGQYVSQLAQLLREVKTEGAATRDEFTRIRAAILAKH